MCGVGGGTVSDAITVPEKMQDYFPHIFMGN